MSRIVIVLAAVALAAIGCSSSSVIARVTPSPTVTTSALSTPLPAPSPAAGQIVYPTTVVLSAPSADVVWAYVDDYLFRSADRGATWERKTLPLLGGGRRDISFLSDHEGWLLVSGVPETQCNSETAMAWHTADAGATWQQLASTGLAGAQCKEEVSFVDSFHGFVGAWDDNHPPVIYGTADGGQTWTASSPLPDPPGWTTQSGGFTLRVGKLRAFGSLLLVSASGNQSGAAVQYVFRSTDGGATWTYLATAPSQIGAFAFVTATRWVQFWGNGAIETTDGGASWHPFATKYMQAAPIAPFVLFADASVGYATVRGSIQLTEDDGVHWSLRNSPGS